MGYSVDSRDIVSLHLAHEMPELGKYIALPELCFQTNPEAIIISDPYGETRYALVEHEYELDVWDTPLLTSLLGFDPSSISDDFAYYWTDDDGDVEVPITLYRIRCTNASELLGRLTRQA